MCALATATLVNERILELILVMLAALWAFVIVAAGFNDRYADLAATASPIIGGVFIAAFGALGIARRKNGNGGAK